MPEPDSSEALQGEIDAAEQTGDLGLASELYRKQIGNVDPYGLEPAAPEVQDEGKGEVIAFPRPELGQPARTSGRGARGGEAVAV